MISQLRIYTVNRGMMDQWVEHFQANVRPILEKYGSKIDGTWVQEDKSQFIWIRSFRDEEAMEAGNAAMGSSPEWAAVIEHTQSHIARIDVQNMSPA